MASNGLWVAEHGCNLLVEVHGMLTRPPVAAMLQCYVDAVLLQGTLRVGSTTKVLAKCMLMYCRIL